MAVKIVDVARHAGVSSATVSRVLSGKPQVSDETRRRVLAAVDELGYQPSRVARNLRIQRSRIIGLVISDIQNPFFTAIVRAVEDVAYRHQYSLFLCNLNEDPEKEALYVDLMLAEKVAGVIVSSTNDSGAVYQKLIDARIPVVAIDRRIDDVTVDTVVVDNEEATCRLIGYLIDKGCRRIGAVIGETTISTGRERMAGYHRALAEHGMPFHPELIRMGMPQADVGYRLAGELLDLDRPPTALFAGNNLLMIGVLRAVYERRLSIPADIALAAFDEMEWMFVIPSPLTVMAQPTHEMGNQAATMLLERIEDYDRPIREITFSPTLRTLCAFAIEES